MDNIVKYNKVYYGQYSKVYYGQYSKVSSLEKFSAWVVLSEYFTSTFLKNT